jgi:hypothetical protein
VKKREPMKPEKFYADKAIPIRAEGCELIRETVCERITTKPKEKPRLRCQHCGRMYVPTRSKRFCSPNCRVFWNRAKKQVKA